MQKGSCFLKGENTFDIVIEAFTTTLKVGYFTKIKDGVILYIDDMSFLNRSNVLTTILIENEEDACRIEVISGGGAEGIFQMSWGSERRRVEKVMSIVDQVCQVHSFKMDHYYVGNT